MKYFQILLFLGINFSTLLLGQSIEIPHKMMKQDTTFNIPIFIYDVSNLESIQLKIEYDETIINALEIIENPVGILDDNYIFCNINISVPGIIHLGICSNSGNMFSGSGMVAQIIFNSIGNLGEFSAITFLDAQINSDWQVLAVDGSIEIILDELMITGQDNSGIGANHSITLGMCNGCNDEWKFGEDEEDYPDPQAEYTNIHFYHPEWLGQVDDNGNICNQFEFATDHRSQHSFRELTQWIISGSTSSGINPDIQINLSWDSNKLNSTSDNFQMYIFVGDENGVNMQQQNNISIDQSDLALNENNEPNIWVKMGGCADTGGTVTYYQDFDGDGLGSSVEREFCEGLQLEGWVETNDGDTCDGDEDCLGVCGGHAIKDECDVCDLDNNNNNQCIDCNEVPYGEALLDNCNSCVEGDTGEVACQLDCLGVWGGNATDSECGTCSSPNSIDECGVCDSNITNNCQRDCQNVWGGLATIDDCGICDSDSSNNNQCFDCNNLANGLDGIPNNGDEAYFDNCGECDNDSSNDCQLDCTEEWGGGASFDNCQICAGGTTGLIPCEQDCNDDWGGYAFMDECDICDSDNNNNNQCFDCNFEPNGGAIIDNCNECVLSGVISSCVQGCDGIWNNNGFEVKYDECGVCGGNNSSCTDCFDDVNGEAQKDACGICAGGNSGVDPCPIDCLDEPNGYAIEDNCGTCDIDTSNDCLLDCNGVWGGDARVDEHCGICIGGTTGLEPCIFDCSGYCGEDDLCIGGSNEGGDCSVNSDNDCPGIWGGNYTTDLCGICDADSENNNQCVDCNGTVDGVGELDNCGNCVEDLSDSSYECEQDCDGIWGGNHPPTFTCYNGEIACNYDACYLANNELQLPQRFDISRIYPNPFNPQANIDFEVSKPTMVKLNIYNLNGRKVDVLKNAFTLPGHYSVIWNGTNHPSGIYFIILQSSNSIIKQKMMLIK